MSQRGRAWPRLIVLLALAAAVSGSARGAGCNRAPSALDDAITAAFEPVLVDVLANDSEADGEALSVAVLATTCPAAATVDGDLVLLTPSSPVTADCTVSYRITDEAGAAASATVRVTAAAPTAVFVDDFETGSTSRWSACEPSCG